ncbi:MAG: hypothetical protein FWH43_01010 [Endomicrobia bacterium]|nr:hypothetical protein [Endomicrobiia bacterium]
MLKKSVSLLFVFMLILSGSTVASADIKTFSGIILNNISAKETNCIGNDIRLARDYSQVITDVCKNFVNDVMSLAISLDFGKGRLSLQKAAHDKNFTAAFVSQQFSRKNIFTTGSFAGIRNAVASNAANAFFFILILGFMLRYIGLLRLFSGDHSFTKQIGS